MAKTSNSEKGAVSAVKRSPVPSYKSHSSEDLDSCPFIVIENVSPEIDNGVFPAKSVVGEPVIVEADILKDGHDVIAASIRYRKAADSGWLETPLTHFDNDRWRGSFIPTENTRYLFTLSAWMDPFTTWCRNTEKKCLANVPIASDLSEGLEILKRIKSLAAPQDCALLDDFLKRIREFKKPSPAFTEILKDPRFLPLASRYPLKDQLTAYGQEIELVVDRKRAVFSAWYEIFPRSQGKIQGRSATFKDCIARLPDIQKMGFDVLYLAPIHPIGKTNRKGPNNSLIAGPDAPGSPWAIGSEAGGHKAIHPELGTLEDFEEFVKTSGRYGLEIAMDIAFQCSPDHPYVKEHPDWFYHLPDGSIRYAENPPKKYEDIYPLNFYCKDRAGLWSELESVFRFWIEHGVKIFRVDNPHTKPLHFWHWVIQKIQKDHPEVLFLSEAFTRPKMMKFLAKAGFTQSYTYFTWRNTKTELRQYLEELTRSEMRHYFRGNFFANTPDILHEFLQKGGRNAFKIRLLLAATLSSSYGIYSGFELCENRAKASGTEDYLDSEKYQYKVWDWERPGNIKDLVTQINQIRKDHPALQGYTNLEFYDSRNEWILCYGKRTPDNKDIVVAVVNLHPEHAHEDTINLPLWKFGIDEHTPYSVKDLLTGKKYIWKGPSNYIRLDPKDTSAHLFQISKT